MVMWLVYICVYANCTKTVQNINIYCNRIYMGIFKNEVDTKRVIFNVRFDLAERLEKAKSQARSVGKKLDIDVAVDKAIEKFLKKAEKKLAEMTSEMSDNGIPGENPEYGSEHEFEIEDADELSSKDS